MKYFPLIYCFIFVLSDAFAQHQCILCNRTSMYVPPIFIDGADSITLHLYDEILSCDRPNMSQANILEQYDYCFFRQCVLLEFLKEKKITQGDVKGTLEINDSGKIDCINQTSNTHLSKRKSSYIKEVLSSPCFVPAHEQNISRSAFWRYHICFDALFRKSIKSYNHTTISNLENNRFTVNVFYNGTTAINITDIDNIIYTTYCNNPEQSVAFFISNMHNSCYPLWVRAIFASYLPIETMDLYITKLCNNNPSDSNDIEKKLFYRELEIIQKQREALKNPLIMKE